MKLTLLDYPLSITQRRALAERGLELTTTEGGQQSAAHIVVTYLPTDLDRITAIRLAYPSSWFCILYNDREQEQPLTDAQLTSLGECGVNELLPEEHWVEMIAFSIGCARYFAAHHISPDILSRTEHLLEQTDRNVELGSQAHNRLLPIRFASLPGVNLSAKYSCARAGHGSDYFDVFELGDKKRIAILLTDSATHKLAASVLSVLLQLDIEIIRSHSSSPVELVEHILSSLDTEPTTGQLNISYAIFNRADLSLQIATLGELGVVVRSGNSLLTGHSVKRSGIGLRTYTLAPDAWAVLLTDGWAAALGCTQSDWIVPIERLVRSTPGPDPVWLQQELMGLIDENTKGAALSEDLTCVQLHIDEQALFIAPQQ